MQRSFRSDLQDPSHFTLTVEVVLEPAAEGKAMDIAKAIAGDALKDGRLSAISVTDNPGGNASLTPEAVGREVLDMGMDVLIHCACRDMNRIAIESRVLQLARAGLRNILALTGDFPESGFGGKGAPVFDLDAVNLLHLLCNVSGRVAGDGAEKILFRGCGVSPFKSLESEGMGQYAKLRRKVDAGAEFIITQLGYDARKFQELLQMEKLMGIECPTMASLYIITPGAARHIHGGGVPGAVVTDALLAQMDEEKKQGVKVEDAAIERAARLGAILKGLGYRGVHIGGMHKSFERISKILDRMEAIGEGWEEFLPQFDLPQKNGYYMFKKASGGVLSSDEPEARIEKAQGMDTFMHNFMDTVHASLFTFDSPLSGVCKGVSGVIDGNRVVRGLAEWAEDASKSLLLDCQACGDCAIQHIGYLCPESQCVKRQCNGPCGDSLDGLCPHQDEKPCIWVRAYRRLAAVHKADKLAQDHVPPRVWACDRGSSWLNFHLRRDHQSLPSKDAALFDAPTSVKEEEAPVKPG